MKYIIDALTVIVADLTQEPVDIELTKPEPEFGDYTTNVALRLSKPLKQAPQAIAATIAQKLTAALGENYTTSVAGPGFINITIPDSDYIEVLANVDDTFGANGRFADTTVMVEFTDPNPFKEMHIGHAYSNTIGEGICRLIEAGGASVIRASYHGDVGMHVAKAMWGIRNLLAEQDCHMEDITEDTRPGFLGAAYARGAAAFDEDEESKREITALNKKIYALQDHPELEQLYLQGRAWSFAYFEEIYARLGTHFDTQYFESQSAPLGLQTSIDAVDKGIFKKSNGAIIFEGEKHGLHTRVFVNSEGLPTYEAKDLGLAPLKAQDYNYDRSIIITAEEQTSYFKVIIKALQLLTPELGNKTEHIAHGVVKLSSGKMSSRTGKVISAHWLLETVEKAVKERSPASPATEANMLGAIKYAFLKARIGGDIIFDIDESISLEGNSGPYLQYAAVRAQSILNKSTLTAKNPTTLEADERALLRKMADYPTIVIRAQDSVSPHHICTYLYELAQDFNRFYENNRIVGNSREAERITLVQAYHRIMTNGLTVLNIPTPAKM